MIRLTIPEKSFLPGHSGSGIPAEKRLLDCVFALTLVFVLSPVLLLIAVLIKLDSRGPVLYKSRRVGTNYRIFDLYKFRTMKTGADLLVAQMAPLNIYQKETPAVRPGGRCENCIREGKKCQALLYTAGKVICETVYQQEKKREPTFRKFQNDPRITRIGRLLRSTSLDELPQLFNILKGDMSLVGNRPLPVYEAEKLTTDASIIRFAAPAGITGLWQVSKRRKREVSEEERIQLDIEYARHHSFRMDLKIILQTFPALFQKKSL
jgi:lipopolysaccharide/colanic/teichoic acid biosynthesis glycosyltransferase